MKILLTCRSLLAASLCFMAAGLRPEEAGSDIILHVEKGGQMLQHHHRNNEIDAHAGQHQVLAAAAKNYSYTQPRHSSGHHIAGHDGSRHDDTMHTEVPENANKTQASQFSTGDRKLYLAGIVYTCVLLSIFVIMWTYRESPITCLQLNFGLVEIVYMASATSIVPTSYTLMTHLGFGGTASGWLIGCTFAGQAPGVLHMFRIMGTMQDEHLHTVLYVCYALVGLSMLMFSLAANPIAIGIDCGPHAQIAALFASRFAAGWVRGYARLIEAKLYFDITPRRDYMGFQVFTSCVITVGIGCGALLASAASWTLGEDNTVEEVMSLSALTLALLSLPTVVIPCCILTYKFKGILEEKQMKDAEDIADDSHGELAVAVEHLDISVRQHIWFVGALLGVIRAMAAASVEGATSFILQNEFGWGIRSIGIAVGCAFLVGLPFTCVVKSVQHAWGISNLRAMLAIAMLPPLAALLLWPGMRDFLSVGHIVHGLHGEEVLVLLSDSILFPSFYLLSGFMDGLGVVCCMPGTAYCIENYKLWDILGQDAVGRFIAPAIVRFLLEHHGRRHYALLQLGLTTVALLMCSNVVWHVHKHDHSRPARRAG